MINLCTIGIVGKLEFKTSWVKVLVRTSVEKPIMADSTAKIHIEVLHAKVVDMVIELSMEVLLPEVGKGGNGVGNVACSDGRL